MQINTNTFSGIPFQSQRQNFGVFSLVIMLFMGVIFTVAGVAAYKSMQINPSWTRISGKIVGSNQSYSTHGGTTYTPIVSYQVNGQTYQVTGNVGSSSYPINGSPEPVAYDPATPGNAKVVASGTSRTLVLLFPAVGILMLVGAPIAYVRNLGRSRSLQPEMTNPVQPVVQPAAVGAPSVSPDVPHTVSDTQQTRPPSPPVTPGL